MPLSACSTLSGTGFASWPGGAWTPAGSIAVTAQAGAVCVVGRRLPSLSERLASRRTRWHRLRATGWYDQTERQVEIVSGTTVWSHPGRHLPIRYVLVRDGTDEVRPPAVLCTDIKADPLDIRRWFVRRWCTEVTFAEVRRHLGVETQSQWSDQTIARTTPALLGLCAHSGEDDQPFRPKVITDSGDRDHAVSRTARPGVTVAARRTADVSIGCIRMVGPVKATVDRPWSPWRGPTRVA